jgi:hypothetical protein
VRIEEEISFVQSQDERQAKGKKGQAHIFIFWSGDETMIALTASFSGRKYSCGLVFLLPLCILSLFFSSSSALAATAAPGWIVRSTALPTSLKTGGGPDQEFTIVATNVGLRSSSGTIVIKDELPPGITSEHTKVWMFEPAPVVGDANAIREEGYCPVKRGPTVLCEYSGPVPPGGIVYVPIKLTVASSAASVLNHAEVTEVGGGGALSARTELPGTQPTPLDITQEEFGIASFTAAAYGPSGQLDITAGDHPSTLVSSIAYNNTANEANTEPFQVTQEPKTQVVNLPMGLLGDALSAPRCPEVTLSALKCPTDTRIGTIGLFKSGLLNNPSTLEVLDLFNVTPEGDYPAEFGFNYLETIVLLRPRLLPSGDGYVLSTDVPDTPRAETEKIHEVVTTIFGDPSASDGGPAGEAFLTNPVDCAAGTLSASLEVNSWEAPDDWVTPLTEEAAGVSAPVTRAPVYAAGEGQGMTGCQRLRFEPQLQVAPQGTQADSPAGYEVKLGVPQTPNYEGELASSDLKGATVTFPAGVSVSPSAANGLVACQESGPEGIDLGNHDAVNADQIASEEHATTGQEVQEGEVLGPDDLVHPAPGHCPLASQIGEVEAVSPLLEKPLTGHVYVAAPKCGNAGQPACTPASAQDGELFGVFLELSGSGVIVKQRLRTDVNPVTGQVSTIDTEVPEVPFSELKIRLNGGQRAPLANPQSCGTDTSTSDLVPWSTPYTPDATPSSSFVIGGCTGGFAPSFGAGMSQSLQAGAYSSFTTTFSRHDGEEDLSGVQVALPPGLLGKIAGVGQCGEAEVKAAEANTGGCPESSRLGTVTAAAGAGGAPFWQSGNAYLTGPYDGAPFGLVFVVPANAGPFHLGNIVVRARIEINQTTAQATITANPLPQMIDGVPLRVQSVSVNVNREGFTFNATNCDRQQITGTISSAQGAQASVSSAYAPTGCAGMSFKPSFSASSSGRTSKQDGASLTVKIAKQSDEANIAKVDLTIPNQLPSRLTTLQKACTEAQFNVNPAGCPAASDIATATVHTPLLNAPLTGPVFFVSHGGAAFPDVEMVLQGEDVKLIVDGHTQIKNGVTYSRFETVPDAPFSTFEFDAPQGPYSIFSANGDLCAPTKSERVKTKVTVRSKGRTRKVTRTITKTVSTALEMPTTIVGQNGAVFTQDTKIGVTGCPKMAMKGKAKAKSAKSKSRK